jgi:1,4-dihydroxy-6-naphthoate synthase
MQLTLGYSPCPNDTFIFGALALGLVSVPDVSFDIRLEDVETLNQWAVRSALDVTKASFAAYVTGGMRNAYALLASGAALGRGCGPLVVARNPLSIADLRGARIATPGRLTTAHLLLRLFLSEATMLTQMPFEKIMPAVAAGHYDAGVIIHESRFTYSGYGLHKVADLGEWWERETGRPLPLGGIFARRTLGAPTLHALETGIADSLRFAQANPGRVAEYVRRHAQELDADVRASHIALYVNEFSLDLGDEGRAALDALAARADALPCDADSPY